LGPDAAPVTRARRSRRRSAGDVVRYGRW
jgi:hypothetical protein